MVHWPARAALTACLALLPPLALAEVDFNAADVALAGVGTAEVPIGYVSERDPWIDRAQRRVFNTVWRSAMRLDHMFGATEEDVVYQRTSGSLATAFLWDEYDGFRPRVRFQVDVPLPHMNQRLHAFVGRVNREEYVTERERQSGAFPNQYSNEEDETLLGLRYRSPREGSYFDADAGLRVRSPLDPFVKASYVFNRGSSEHTLFTFRETAFWQNSEKFGATSRADIERIFSDEWLVRCTGSGTISQRTKGVRGYASLTGIHALGHRRAFAAELFAKGEEKAPVALKDYGVKLGYRRSISRDWLVLETRLSYTWPREKPEETRSGTWGVGIGVEMFFGTDEFLARPVTF